MNFPSYSSMCVPGSYAPLMQPNEDHVLNLLFQDHGPVGDLIYASKPCIVCRQSADSPMVPCHHQLENFMDHNDIFTPLISPAMTPSYNFHTTQKSLSSSSSSTALHEFDFSPLSSPVINPQHHSRNLSTQSAISSDGYCNPMSPDQMYEQYEQLEQAKGVIARRLSALRQQQNGAPLTTNHDAPMSFIDNSFVVPYEDYRNQPVTPASLMNLKRQASNATLRETEDTIVDKSFHSLAPNALRPVPGLAEANGAKAQTTGSPAIPKPSQSNANKKARPIEKHNRRELKPLLISPTIAPGLDSNPILRNAERILATQSNYQNMVEGKAAALGIAFSPDIHSGLEVRRTAHKAAEQKRRDSLKEWFDRLRQEVEDGYVKKKTALTTQLIQEQRDEKSESSCSPEEDGMEALKPLSKVLLLRYAYEYISELKEKVTQRDERIQQLEQENDKLQNTATEQ